MRIKEFSPGGRGGLKENLITFFRHQLILQFYRGGPMVYFKKNYNFLRFQKGSNTFQGRGVQIFSGGWGGGGPNANFYRNL